MRPITSWGPGVLLLGTLLAGCTSTQPVSTMIGLGQPAPEIQGEDVDGQPMKLSDFRGRVVMLDFWGNW